jgi:hypothetical protein
MSAALLQRRDRRQRPPGLLGREHLRPADHVLCAHTVESNARSAGLQTLDDLIIGAWEGLSVHEIVCCPICDGGMARNGGATSSAGASDGAPLGECGDCGAQLS